VSDTSPSGVPSDQPGHRASGVLRPGRHRRPRDRAGRALAGVGALLVLVACGAGAHAATSGDEPPLAASSTDAAAAAVPVATRNPAADGSWGPVSNQSPVAAPTDRVAAGLRPLGVRIPAIGVDATSLVPLKTIPATGELEAPKEFTQTGWYAAGPVPGEPGPAVIAAHVDSAKDGPAVFFRLKELKAGDKVFVPRSDGGTVTFTVTGVERYAKNAFPTQKVHGPTPDRALRLITCGGSFDHTKGSYRDNIVVYAVGS
jgi:LPXTG-site transpeptidase (sortase) family protein